VQQHLANIPRRGVHGHVERREPVLKDASEVPLLEIRQRREVAVREREAVVVVANVQVAAKSLRQPLDEAEFALVRAPAHARRLELQAERLTELSLDLQLQLRTVGKPGGDEQLLLRGEELPVEEIGELP